MLKQLITFIVLLPLFGYSQTTDEIFIKKISNEIFTNSKAYENLRHLTKKIGPRLSGSAGMYNAENWGYAVMNASGSHNTFKQQCLVPRWDRGGKDEAFVILANGTKKALDALALGNSIATPKKGITAEVVLINSFDELELKKNELIGKIVFYNYKFNPTFVRTFESYGDAVKYRGSGATRAAKYGAVGSIVRSMSHSVDNFPHTGATTYDSIYKIPAFTVGLQDADWLANQLKQNSKVKIYLKSNAKQWPDTTGHNIIGELKGTEFPNQYITVGGHLDSWDNCEGAHDDGAGIVQTIEALRTLAALGYKPKHTIRFVLFANEENGLRGGLKYAEEAKSNNEKHVFALESDAGGFTPRAFSFSGADAQFDKIKSWLLLLKPYGICDIVKGGGGADISPLKKLGAALSGLQPDSQRYFDVHHSRGDTYETVNKRELELGAINITALIYLVDQYGL